MPVPVKGLTFSVKSMEILPLTYVGAKAGPTVSWNLKMPVLIGENKIVWDRYKAKLKVV